MSEKNSIMGPREMFLPWYASQGPEREVRLTKRSILSKRRILKNGQVVKGNCGYDIHPESRMPILLRCKECIHEKRERKQSVEMYYRLCYGGCQKLVWDIFQSCLGCGERDNSCPFCSYSPWVKEFVLDALEEKSDDEVKILLPQFAADLPTGKNMSSPRDYSSDKEEDYTEEEIEDGFNSFHGEDDDLLLYTEQEMYAFDNGSTDDIPEEEDIPTHSKRRESLKGINKTDHVVKQEGVHHRRRSSFGRIIDQETMDIIDLMMKNEKEFKKKQKGEAIGVPGDIIEGTRTFTVVPSYKLPIVDRCSKCINEKRRRIHSEQAFFRVCNGNCGFLVWDIHEKCIDCSTRDDTCPFCNSSPWSRSISTDKYFQDIYRNTKLELAITLKPRRSSITKDGFVVGSRGYDLVPLQDLPLQERCIYCDRERRLREPSIEPLHRICAGSCGKLIWDIHRMCLPCANECNKCPFCLLTPWIRSTESKHIHDVEGYANSEDGSDKSDYKRISSEVDTALDADVVLGNYNGKFSVVVDRLLPHRQRCQKCFTLVRKRRAGIEPAFRLCKGRCNRLVWDIYHRCLDCARRDDTCPFCSESPWRYEIAKGSDSSEDIINMITESNRKCIEARLSHQPKLDIDDD